MRHSKMRCISGSHMVAIRCNLILQLYETTNNLKLRIRPRSELTVKRVHKSEQIWGKSILYPACVLQYSYYSRYDDNKHFVSIIPHAARFAPCPAACFANAGKMPAALRCFCCNIDWYWCKREAAGIAAVARPPIVGATT